MWRNLMNVTVSVDYKGKVILNSRIDNNSVRHTCKLTKSIDSKAQVMM